MTDSSQPPRLALVGAPDAPPSAEPCVVLVDDSLHALQPFARHAGPIITGPGLESPAAGLVRRVPNSNLLDASTRVLFYCSNDTHARTFAPIARHFNDPRFVVPAGDDSGARGALEREGLSWMRHFDARDAFGWAQIGAVANDWDFEERWFIAQCRSMRKPTACLQESTNVDFGPHPFRMQWADYALIQGAHTLKYLRRQTAFLTGNPRYDSFAALPLPESNEALINCNFLYGLGHENARAWIDQVVAALDGARIPWFISVHPRDVTDLSGLPNVVPSGAYSIAEQLARARFVVSRDSSIPYEALLCNRDAIYFAPFPEPERHLSEDDYGLIQKALNSSELRRAVDCILDRPGPRENAAAPAVLEAYFGALDGLNHRRAASALSVIALDPARYACGDARVESALKTGLKTRFIVGARPAIRKVPALRALWRRYRSYRGAR